MSFAMPALTRQEGELCLDGARLSEIAAEFGTPCYVYSRATMESAYRALDVALAGVDHQICYAMKANSNLAVLRLFAKLGAGFDIVSGGELARVMAAGGDPRKVIFSGVGKKDAEMAQALRAGIHCFNVESEAELYRLNAVAAELDLPARMTFRVNPDVDPQTHPYISTGLKGSKFGVAFNEARTLYQAAARLSHIRVVGIECHIGSQITALAPYQDALARLLSLADELATDGIALEHIDLGGGMGIRYNDETPLDLNAFAAMINAAFAGRKYQLLLEPGRALVGHAGLLLTAVEFTKRGETKNFAIVDAAMNDLIRPALYEAHHEITPVRERSEEAVLWQVVGPVCESGDFLGADRRLALARGDLLAVQCAGAYGFAMASNYNTRPRAPEVLVSGAMRQLIRERETVESLFALERIVD